MKGTERILLKLEEMNRYLEELEELFPENEEEYENNLVHRRACEKTVELAIECVISSLSMLVSHFRLGIPQDEEDIISVLEKRKIVSPLVAVKVRTMKGFRNILVHKYGDIDNSKAYASLQQEIEDFALVEKEIKAFLMDQK